MRIVRKQLLIYVAIGIVVVAIGARFLLSGGSSSDEGVGGVALSGVAAAASPSGDASGSGAASGTAASSGTAAASGGEASPSAAAEVVVDVTGAVVSPGVYKLPDGSRVCDAVELAGGTTARAETAAVNLAARLVDGQQIVIPEKGAAGSAGAGGQSATTSGTSTASGSASGSSGGSAGAAGATTALVNLNTATLEELDTLSGVGPSTAQKIIDYREQNGGFRSVEELQEVSGIGDAKYATLKDLVTI